MMREPKLAGLIEPPPNSAQARPRNLVRYRKRNGTPRFLPKAKSRRRARLRGPMREPQMSRATARAAGGPGATAGRQTGNPNKKARIRLRHDRSNRRWI